MISIFRRLTFIFLISQLTTISAYGQSDIQNRAESALAEARSLNEKARIGGARWIIAEEHLLAAEELVSNQLYSDGLETANKAIHFFTLGLEQKKEPLYEHR